MWRLERGNFQYWFGSEWSRDQCIYANTTSDAAAHEDIVHKCDVDDQRFQMTTTAKDGAGRRVSKQLTISRVTGKYTGSYAADTGTRVVSSDSDGTCTPVKDPSLGLQRKF